MITETRQIMADRVKRAMVDVGQRVGRLQTPMTQLMGALRANDMLPERLVALELFGMHGLWQTPRSSSATRSRRSRPTR